MFEYFTLSSPYSRGSTFGRFSEEILGQPHLGLYVQVPAETHSTCKPCRRLDEAGLYRNVYEASNGPWCCSCDAQPGPPRVITAVSAFARGNA